MEVEFADEVALEAAAPSQISTPAPAAQAPDVGPPEPLESAPPPPLPTPAPVPTPQRPAPTPMPAPKAQPQRPAPSRPAQSRPAPAKPAPQQAKPRAPRLGSDFLKGLDDSLAPRGSAQSSAPKFDSSAKMNVGQAIIRQARPCANDQTFLGEGANTLRLTVNLKFNRNGRLARSPTILGIRGDSDLKAKYGDLLEDQVRRIFSQCAPFRLPAELYDTPSGGWNDFTFTYRVE